jgi:hypothetical protein
MTVPYQVAHMKHVQKTTISTESSIANSLMMIRDRNIIDLRSFVLCTTGTAMMVALPLRPQIKDKSGTSRSISNLFRVSLRAPN